MNFPGWVRFTDLETRGKKLKSGTKNAYNDPPLQPPKISQTWGYMVQAQKFPQKDPI